MRKKLAAILFAMGYLVASGAPMMLVGVAPLALSGCERDSELENAAENVGDKIEDAAEDVGDKIEDAGDEAEDKMD
jgi:hypothetical protein